MTARISSGLAAATRIAAGDDRTHYDAVARALHWVTAALVLLQFVLAQLWGFFPRPERHLMIVGHMSFGILLTAALVARIGWRLMPGHQVRAAVSGWVELASKAMHYVLYVLLAAEAALGFLARWSEDAAMSFFGLLIASPLPPLPRAAHRLLLQTHDWIAWAIVLLAAAHALAALFHHFVLRDDVLWRMLPGRRARRVEMQATRPEEAWRG